MASFIIIGAGRIADRHVRAIQECGGDLIGVFDIDQEKMNCFCTTHNADPIESFEQAKLVNPDYFVICTDSGSHYDLAMELVDVAKGLIIEKPMCVSLQDSQKLVEKAQQNNTQLFVAHQNRFNHSVQFAKKYLSDNSIDRVNFGNVTMRWCRDDAYYAQASWRGTFKDDGSVISNQAIHHLDLLIHFLGRHESVFAFGETFGSKIEVPDTVMACVRFASGAMATIEATTAIRPKNIEASLTLSWNTGTLKIGGTAANKIDYLISQNEMPELKGEAFAEDSADVYGVGHIELYRHVVEEIECESLVSGADSLSVLKLINDIHVSLEENREVLCSEDRDSKYLGQ